MKIHSAYFGGKMLRSDAPRNKIYLMSFNLTVVLSQLRDRGRHTRSWASAAARSRVQPVQMCSQIGPLWPGFSFDLDKTAGTRSLRCNNGVKNHQDLITSSREVCVSVNRGAVT